MRRLHPGVLVLAGAAVLLGLGAVRLLHREGAGTGPPPAPLSASVGRTGGTAAPPPISPSPRTAEGGHAVPQGPHKTGNSIRLRRPDGSYEVVEETTELLDALTSGAFRRTVAQFEAVQRTFRDEFTRTLRQSGPAAAWQLLVPQLRTPTSENDDTALVTEAVRLLAEIQRDLGATTAGRTSPYEPIRAAVSAGLVGFLDNPDVRSFTKGVALLYLTGQRLTVLAAGPERRVVDGLVAYDPDAVWQAFVVPDQFTPPASAGPGLQDPDVLRSCLRILQDPATPGSLRGQSLQALGAVPGVVDRLDLLALSRDPNADVAQAAVELLGSRPAAVPGDVFFSLLSSRDDPAWKSLVFRRLSEPAFDSPQMMSVLTRDLPSSPVEPDDYKNAVYQATVLDLSLGRYARQPDRNLLDLLARFLVDWAPHEWNGQNSPVVAVATFAGTHGLREFASPLRAVVDQLPSPEDREAVRAALGRLGR